MSDNTPEFFAPLSHGIWDHSEKFLARPLSFMLYTYMLCYAKSKGVDRGKISFPIKELAAMLSFGRDHGAVHEADLKISTTSIRRALNHLEEIKFIEVLARGATRKDDCWVISINKYKGGADNFPSVFQAASDTEGQPTLVPLDDSHLDTFEQKNDTLFDNEEEDARAQEESHRYDFSGLASLPNPAVSINLMKLASASTDSVLVYNRDFVILAESETKYDEVLENIRVGTYRGQSSEEILPVAMAAKMAAHLTNMMRDKKHASRAELARFELVRLYWNGMRTGGKSILTNSITPLAKDDDRLKKINTRFKDKFFAEKWAEAIVKAKNSPHCRGDNGWVADLVWFIKNSSSMRNIMEGKYANGRSKQGPKGPTRNFDYDSYTSAEAPRSALDEVSLGEGDA